MTTANDHYSVYMHVFPNGKKYFGITSRNPETRWRRGLGYATGTQKRLAAAITRFGWDNVTHIILLTNLDLKTAELAERFLIKKEDSTNPIFGYNISLGGHHAGKVSTETRKRISEANKKRIITPEHKKRISATLTGRISTKTQREALLKANKTRVITPETREKLRASRLGKTMSPEAKAKISAAHKGKEISETTRAKMRNAKVGIPFSTEHIANIQTTKRLKRTKEVT